MINYFKYFQNITISVSHYPQVKGLHPELTAVAKGTKMDKHPLTPEQSNFEGIPKEQAWMYYLCRN